MDNVGAYTSFFFADRGPVDDYYAQDVIDDLFSETKTFKKLFSNDILKCHTRKK